MHATCLCGSVAWDVDTLTVHGREHIVRFDSSPDFFRNFCGRCGSVVPGAPFDGQIFLPAGNFDSDPGIRTEAHIFAASNPPWYAITDSLPRYDGYPPEFGVQGVPDQPRASSTAPIHGSCLCNAVAFEATGDPLVCRHCHCTRCRKARSAAHASNLVVPIEGFRFVRGEDRLGSWKVPEAQFFTQAFCRTCGSPMPRVDTERGFVVIAMGALDADPGVGPRNHIFVGSKAPWFEITDALPQFIEQQTG